MIPLSLIVTMELVKVALKWLIDRDAEMVDNDGGSAQARNSNLVEELGMVEYVFSDKTGTLTQNKMNFLECSVAGVRYGNKPHLVVNTGVTPIDEVSYDQVSPTGNTHFSCTVS